MNNEHTWKYSWEPKDFFEVYDKKIKKIVNVLIDADEEISMVFNFRNQEEQDIISANVQLILIFTFIDILGNYYNAYLGEKGSSHTKKFNDFVEKFCLVNENIYFRDRKHMQNITSESLRNLRNGLVHFYGIGIQKNIIIASNTISDNNIIDIVNKNSLDKNPIIIVPDELQKIIHEGSQLFMKKFNINEQHTPEEKLEKMDAVDRILKKIAEEGGVLIRLD